MEALQQALIDYGYWGMFLSAILAGSVVPFSSEVVMLGLMAAGLDRWPLIIWATVGNVLGALLTYYMGRLGRIDWIEKYCHVKREKLDKMDGVLRLYTHPGQCHHYRPRTDARQHPHIAHQHGHRQVPALRATCLRHLARAVRKLNEGC